MLSEQAANVALLRDRLQIDAAVAAHALAALEAEGTVGPAEAEGGHEVLKAWALANSVPRDPSLSEFLCARHSMTPRSMNATQDNESR